MKTIAITIDEDILERVDRLTGAKRMRSTSNRSMVIRTAVREYLDRLERAAGEAREREIFKQHSRKLSRQAKALVREQARL